LKERFRKIIRFELETSVLEKQPRFGVNKILLFNSDLGELSAVTLSKTFICEPNINLPVEIVKIVEDFADGDAVKIVHNPSIRGAFSAPFKLFFDITYRCQLRCSYCLSGTKLGTKKGISKSYWKPIIQNLGEAGLFYLKLGGGEPTLHPDIKEIISFARSFGIFCSFSTNGYGMTEDFAHFLKLNCVKVSISLEGLERTHDRLRIKGQYNAAIKALRILRKFDVNVVLRMTLLKETLSDIPEYVMLAKENGVKAKFSYGRPSSYIFKSDSLLEPKDKIEYNEAIRFLNRPEIRPFVLLDDQMEVIQEGDVIEKRYLGNACGAGNRSIHITPKRKISPCVFLGQEYSEGIMIGTPMDYWLTKYGTSFKKVRNIQTISECNSCSRTCTNACPANRLHFFNKLSRQDPNCLNSGGSGYLQQEDNGY
jgi:MoaA/NifB/PqqE/SkfB family radical SAM enzyme